MSSAFPTSVAAASALADPPPLVLQPPPEAEDEDEWEYEYSSTETETYYMTVDLSIPQFARRWRPIPASTRGGHQHKSWTQPSQRKRPAMTHHRLDSDEEDKDDDLPEPEDDDEEDEELEDERGQGGTSQQHPEAAGNDGDGGGTGKDAFPGNEEPAVDEIQILDLHTEHPLFGYRNRIFKGSWSRVLGTELIFADQTPDHRGRRLPCLRSLPGEVDLLAASWARMATTEMKVAPKHVADQGPDRFRDIKLRHGIRIPVWGDKTGERKIQTRFLEDLMALKLKKKEKDDVTVYAQAPAYRDRLSAIPRVRRGGWKGAGRRGGGDGAADDDEGARKRRKPLPSGRPKADGRKNRVRWHARGRGRGKGAIAGGQAVMDRPELLMDNGENSDEEISTPTPDKWSDLEGTFRIEGHEDDVEMAEADGGASAADAPEGEGSRRA
ncbi:hypothetical protein HYQ45_015025 [Verticillium longisporum]|uniref:Transcription factor TFIIIC triple barrel domain-containing protein n=1 Tax=Verticillium longisporum TaxID=100787 RepID=A0A8I2ZB48_VERLO|nr:hypothetical protein HYQ45_015025 [Verticillium longisporum]